MSLVRVRRFSVSLDGFATGEGQSKRRSVGRAGERLHDSMFTTRWRPRAARPSPAEAAASTTRRAALRARHRRRDDGSREGGASGMAGRPGVAGQRGARPAFPHAGLRPRPSHAPVDRDPGRDDVPLPRRPAAEALANDREAATAEGVRIGGSATVMHEFLATGLIDHMPLWSYRSSRPRRAAVGRTGGPRAGLRDRGRLLAQRITHLTFTVRVSVRPQSHDPHLPRAPRNGSPSASSRRRWRSALPRTRPHARAIAQ